MTTKSIVAHIGSHLKLRLPWIMVVKYLGRVDPSGAVIADEEYAGINDKLGANGYFRFSGMYDHDYTVPAKRTTSVPNYDRTANLRFVLLHNCTNVEEIENAVYNELLLAPHTAGAPDYSVIVTKSTTDTQGVFLDETGQEHETTNLRWKLMAFEMKVTYRVVVNASTNCIPTCDEC